MVPIYGIMNSGVPASATANPTLVNPVNAAIARNVHDAGAKFNSDMLNADGSPNEKSQLLQSGLSKYGIKFADYLKMPEAKKAALREEFATTSVIQNTLTSTDAKWLSGISPAAMYTNPQLAPHVPVALSGALDWQTAFNLVVAGHATPQQLQGMIQQGMKVENANSNRDSMGLKPVSSMPITLKVPGKWFGGVAGNSDLLVDMGNLDSIKLAVLQVKRSQQAANTTAAAVSNMGL
jgi:hypothetical protein